ncbi:MAG TPA: hypothetical protein VGF94_08055 [Kofleriaceae bacterium]
MSGRVQRPRLLGRELVVAVANLYLEAATIGALELEAELGAITNHLTGEHAVIDVLAEPRSE